MMIFRHLSVLLVGALLTTLAMASTSSSAKNSKSESEQSKSKSKSTKKDTCPCFDAEKVASAVDFAKDAGYCGFAEITTPDFRYLLLYAQDSQTVDLLQEFSEENYFLFETQTSDFYHVCQKASMVLHSNDDTSKEDFRYTNLTGSFAEDESYYCEELLEDVKDEMRDLGCVISPCEEDGYVGPYCNLSYPECNVEFPFWIGDGECDGEPYSNAECGNDGGDCVDSRKLLRKKKHHPSPKIRMRTELLFH